MSCSRSRSPLLTWSKVPPPSIAPAAHPWLGRRGQEHPHRPGDELALTYEVPR